jgi:hypothetical protein
MYLYTKMYLDTSILRHLLVVGGSRSNIFLQASEWEGWIEHALLHPERCTDLPKTWNLVHRAFFFQKKLATFSPNLAHMSDALSASMSPATAASTDPVALGPGDRSTAVLMMFHAHKLDGRTTFFPLVLYNTTYGTDHCRLVAYCGWGGRRLVPEAEAVHWKRVGNCAGGTTVAQSFRYRPQKSCLLFVSFPSTFDSDQFTERPSLDLIVDVQRGFCMFCISVKARRPGCFFLNLVPCLSRT